MSYWEGHAYEIHAKNSSRVFHISSPINVLKTVTQVERWQASSGLRVKVEKIGVFHIVLWVDFLFGSFSLVKKCEKMEENTGTMQNNYYFHSIFGKYLKINKEYDYHNRL